MWEEFLQHVFQYLPARVAIIVAAAGIAIWAAIHLFLAIKEGVGLRKDLADTKKTNMEIKAMEAADEKANSLIQPATFEDVKRFDPKVGILARKTVTERNELLKELSEYALLVAPVVFVIMFVIEEAKHVIRMIFPITH